MSIAEKALQLKQDLDDVCQKGQNMIASNVKQMQLTSLNAFGQSEAVLNLDSATTLAILCAVGSSASEKCINNTVEHLTINCPNRITSMQQMLQCAPNNTDNTLKRLTFNVDTSNVTAFTNAFNNLTALEIIDGTPFSFRGLSSNQYAVIDCFSGCFNLTDFRVEKESLYNNFTIKYTPNLSTETIQNGKTGIIDGLVNDPWKGDYCSTLTLHADVGERLTDEQKATITAKNWTIVY